MKGQTSERSNERAVSVKNNEKMKIRAVAKLHKEHNIVTSEQTRLNYGKQ